VSASSCGKHVKLSCLVHLGHLIADVCDGIQPGVMVAFHNLYFIAGPFLWSANVLRSVFFKEWDDKVLDYPSGSYSGVDVDAVDFAKYPQLANVRYGVVHMEAGDCLFIPYKWYELNYFM